MINTVIIQRIKLADGSFPTNSTVLPGSYTMGGKIRVLNPEGAWSAHPIDERDNSGKLVERQIADYNFSKYMPTIRIEYEADETKRTSADRNKVDAVKDFWGFHPLVLINGKIHANTSPAAQFNLVDLRDESMDNLNKFKDVLQAANMVAGMESGKRRDVAYYYGISPSGKSDGELTLLLANFGSGMCTNQATVGEFLKVWGSTSNADRDMTVTIKKAVTLHVIINKPLDGRNNYYLGQELIGTSENDLLSYSKSNPEVYNEFILRTVNEKDTFKAETKESEKQALATKDAKQYSQEEVTSMRMEIKELKKDGHVAKSFNEGISSASKLVEMLAVGRSAKEKAVLV